MTNNTPWVGSKNNQKLHSWIKQNTARMQHSSLGLDKKQCFELTFKPYFAMK